MSLLKPTPDAEPERAPAAAAQAWALPLAELSRLRFAAPFEADPHVLLAREAELRAVELQFVEAHRALLRPRLDDVPHDPTDFVAWLEDVQTGGPGQGDPLFEWLETQADDAEFRWFLQQEVAGEAGFDDLVALTQVKLATQEKLELARNYWDEMGRGQKRAMHGPMLAQLARTCRLDAMQTPILWEAQAVGYMMSALAGNRWYVHQSLGALGAVELTAWRRAERVNRGLRRLGYAGQDRIYYAVHATLDKKHGEAWTREVFVPLVRRDPKAARALAEGLLLRLTLGAQSYAAYRRVLWGEAARRPAKRARKQGEHHVGHA